MAVEHDRSFGARVVGWAYGAYFSGVRAMPIEGTSAAGSWLLRTFGPLMSANKIARKNLEIAFPDKDDAWRDEVLKGMWDNLGRVLGEFPHLPDLVTFGPEGRIEVEGAERFEAIKAGGKGAVFISGHFANWEIMASVIVRHDVPCQVTYRAMNNGFVDDRVAVLRQAYGAKMLAAKGRTGGMALLRALMRGESVAMMNDQKNNEGAAAPFFGSRVMTADGPTRLARRFGCPLVPMSIERLPGVRFKVGVHEPIEMSDNPDEDVAVAETVARVNAFMEEHVRAAPEQWFWVHRRWPRTVYKSASAFEAAAAASADPFAADTGTSSSASAGST